MPRISLQILSRWAVVAAALAAPAASTAAPPTITTPPSVTQDAFFTVQPAYVLGAAVTPVYSCATGPGNCVPGPFSTSTLGEKGFTVTDTGNATQTTHAYRVVPPRYGSYVLGSDPIAYYRMDDPKGAGDGEATDSSGDNHTGDYKNDVVLKRRAGPACERRAFTPTGCAITNDPQGWSAFYDGLAAHVRVDDIDAPSMYTMEAWVFWDGDKDGGIIDHGNNNGALFVRNGHLWFHAQDTDIDGGLLSDDEWHHVAGTWDGAAMRLYVDGVEVVTGQTGKATSGTPTFYVGLTNQPVSNLWWDGWLDEVAYYDHALSAGEIANRWAIGNYEENNLANAVNPNLNPHDAAAFGPGPLDTTRPLIGRVMPAGGSKFNKASPKIPVARFRCYDPDPWDPVLWGGPGCTAVVNGPGVVNKPMFNKLNPPSVPAGSANPTDYQLPQATPGNYTFTVSAQDAAGLKWQLTHKFAVYSGFRDLVMSDKPIAYWRFNEPSSDSVAQDQTGDHDGTYRHDQVQGPQGVSGDGASSRRFFGQAGYVDVQGIPAGVNGYTIETWIKPDDPGDMVIFDHGAAGGGPALYIQGGRYRYRPLEDILLDGGPIKSGWVNVVARWDGVLATIWINGVKIDELEVTKNPSGTPALYIGNGNVGLSSPWFRGLIDEVSYYDHNLTDRQVEDQWRADPPAVVKARRARAKRAGGRTH